MLRETEILIEKYVRMHLLINEARDLIKNARFIEKAHPAHRGVKAWDQKARAFLDKLREEGL